MAVASGSSDSKKSLTDINKMFLGSNIINTGSGVSGDDRAELEKAVAANRKRIEEQEDRQKALQSTDNKVQEMMPSMSDI